MFHHFDFLVFLDIFLRKQRTNCPHSHRGRGYWLPSDSDSSKSCAVNTGKPGFEGLLLHCTILNEIQRFQEEQMRLHWSLAQTSKYLWKRKKEMHKIALAESFTFRCFKNASRVRAYHWVMLQAWAPHPKMAQIKFSWYHIPLLSDTIAVLTRTFS